MSFVPSLKIIYIIQKTTTDCLHCEGLAVESDWYFQIRLENMTKNILYVFVCNPIRYS